MDGLLEQLADDEPLPAGGSVAAAAVALAASLGSMVAHRSGRPDLVETLAWLRRRAAELVREDAEVYGEVLDAVGLDADDPARASRLRAALTAAAEPPIEIVALAAEVVGVVVALASGTSRDLRGDAIASANVAAGAAAAAAALVGINLPDGDRRSVAADEQARRAHAAADRLRGR